MPDSLRKNQPTSTPTTPATRAPASRPAAPATSALRQNRQPAVALGNSSPLQPAIRIPIERSLGADMSGVRIHTGATAERAAQGLSARAFAYGPNIVLGAGVSPNNLAVVAHEAAHVVQQQSAPIIQRLAEGQHNAYEHEAERAAAAVAQGQQFQVEQRTSGTRLQRLGLSDALSYFADKANLIPGFRMLTIILGVNPINMSRVEHSAANIMRAIVEFLPGGGLVTQALDTYGIFDKVGSWVEQQLATLGMTGSMFKDAINEFLDSLSWSDIFDLGGVWERAKRIFTRPIDQLLSFAKGLITGILTFIKDAVLMPLAKLAEGTRGWDLLIAVLGQNPITGEAVPRTAETLIGGFMKLIGQEEVWENMKKANAISRAWAWFQGAMSQLLAFVQQIPTLAINAFKALDLADLVLLPRAFGKVAAVFGNFIGSFISWAGNAVWNLLEIVFDVLAPAVMPYLRKAAAAFRTILKDPIGFVGNLVRAGKQGFNLFAKNFFEHLKTALIRWITDPLGAAGVYIPKSFNLIEIIKLVLSVLGLTWQNIRTKLLKIIPEPVLILLEKSASILVTLVKDGPAAAWEQIKTELSQLKDQLIAQVVQMVTTEVIKAAVVKLVSMLNPAGAFVQAILAIYNTVTFFIQKINQIAAVVASVIDSIAAIAAGQVDGAAKKVEQTMANSLRVIIAFLAKFAGLGNIPDKVVGVIKKIRQPIDKGLDKIVAWLGKMLKSLVAKALGGDPNAPGPQRVSNALQEAVPVVNRFAGRKIGAAILKPLLAPIRLKHRLTSLTVIARGERWLIEAAASPAVTAPTNAQVDTDAENAAVEIAVISTKQPRASAISSGSIKKLATQTTPTHFEYSTTLAIEQATGLTAEPNARFLTQERPTGSTVANAPAGLVPGPQGLSLPTTPRLFGSTAGQNKQRDVEEPRIEVRGGGDLRKHGLERHPDALLLTPDHIEPIEFTLDANLSKIGGDATRGSTPHKIMQIPGTIDVILRTFPPQTPVVYSIFVKGEVPQARLNELERELRNLQRKHGNIDVTIRFIRR